MEQWNVLQDLFCVLPMLQQSKPCKHQNLAEHAHRGYPGMKNKKATQWINTPTVCLLLWQWVELHPIWLFPLGETRRYHKGFELLKLDLGKLPKHLAMMAKVYYLPKRSDFTHVPPKHASEIMFFRKLENGRNLSFLILDKWWEMHNNNLSTEGDRHRKPWKGVFID